MYDYEMGRILIRNLDDAVLEALRGRAQRKGSSLEEEARQALAASVGLTRDEAIRRLNEVRARIGRLVGPTTLDDLRADRARDD
jgi:plasmid stability protein